ncbi:MAG TPA: hypothetical protein VKT77_06595 [Chthonomonadaceae bacterium]|nr:hypothetical protein [Chthonomonadaceae bacterium]
MPLHPSWQQIVTLDRDVAALKSAPQQAGTMYYAPHGAPALFAPQTATPVNIARERAVQADLDAKRYIDSLRKSLTEANQSVLALERRREQRRVDASVATRLADEAKRLQALNDVRLFAIKERLKGLALRDIVVRSQIQDLAQAHTTDVVPLRKAQDEHASILKEITSIKLEDADIRAQDVGQIAARNRDQFYREEQALSRDRIAARETALAGELRDKVAAAMVQQRDTGVPPPTAMSLPPVDPRATPLPLPQEAGAVTFSGAARVAPAVSREALEWQSQRSAILAEIRADTVKSAEESAARRGWVLVAGPRPDARDGTKEVADDIRTQWRITTAR